jgi:hypothetical protein
VATTPVQARKLLTAAELEVFAASRDKMLKALTPLQLRGKVKRARALRAKYQDLLRRQKLATRDRAGTKLGRSGIANARTAQKAQLFAEVLERFTQRLKQSEAAEARASKKAGAASAMRALKAQRLAKAAKPAIGTAARSPKAPARGPLATGKVGPASERARAARHAMQPKIAGQQKVHAHIAARGRRNQAKRDYRG